MSEKGFGARFRSAKCSQRRGRRGGPDLYLPWTAEPFYHFSALTVLRGTRHPRCRIGRLRQTIWSRLISEMRPRDATDG